MDWPGHGQAIREWTHCVGIRHTGIADFKRSYLCSRLASEGNVVLALEHRDGTGPFVMTRSPIPGMGAKQGAQPKLYLNPDDVE